MKLSELPLEARQRIGHKVGDIQYDIDLRHIRKVVTCERVTHGKRFLPFGTNQDLALNTGYKLHGRQNKHHGRKPGTYKHKRDLIRNSRRRNRASN